MTAPSDACQSRSLPDGSFPPIPLPRSYKVVTLGCKLNQFDTASIEGQLRRRGFREAEEGTDAGVFVINTCTVTANADREARQLMRRARREHPGCRLIVTGCYAELDRERISAMSEVDLVVGRTDRARFPELLDELSLVAQPAMLGADLAPGPAAPGISLEAGPARPGIALEAGPAVPRSALEGEHASPSFARQDERSAPEIACIEAAADLPALHFGDKTRAFLKVQEGCDLSCSYCIIPTVRGKSRSVSALEITASLEALVARGYAEVVLTGVNTGDYGKDLTQGTSLAGLMERLVAVPGLGRLRLNSLEPRTVTGDIVALLAEEKRIARHLQVPLQSGSDNTLKRMYRNYRVSDYARTLEGLRARIPEIGLGADVIVGFPGETEAEFEETFRFIASSPLNYLHVFSYSDRPGTPASSMDGGVRPEVIRERSARLRALGASLALAFRRSFLRRTLPTLVFHGRRPDGSFRGLTDNFIDLTIAADAADQGSIVDAAIMSVDARGTTARAARSALQR